LRRGTEEGCHINRAEGGGFPQTFYKLLFVEKAVTIKPTLRGFL
jgi:hypothetical protein